jgi:hypothetical protein
VDLLEAAWHGTTAPSFATLEERLAAVIARRPVQELLRNICSSPAWLADVARDSYEHANGFDKFTIASKSLLGSSIRMHVWWSSAHTIEPNIHDHAWDYASYVVAGEYEMRIHEIAERGPDTSEFVHATYPTAAGMDDDRPTLDRVHLRCVARLPMPAGTLYSLERDKLHQIIVPPHRTTVTLVLQEPHSRESSSVFAHTAAALREPLDVRRFTAADVAGKFARLLSELPQP